MRALPHECEEYLEKYDEFLAKSAVANAERKKAVAAARAMFEKACVHEHGRSALAEGLRYSIQQLELALRGGFVPVSTPPPLSKEVRGDLDALAPEDRAFVTFWAGARHQRFAYKELNRLARPGGLVNEMEIEGHQVNVIDGYAETLNPLSTGAITVRFWKTRDGTYFAQESGGCIAYRNTMFGPFEAAADSFTCKNRKAKQQDMVRDRMPGGDS